MNPFGSSADVRVRRSSIETRLDAARLAFACSYSSANEYEAELIRLARERGAYRKPAPGHGFARSGALAALTAAFLIAL